ncbi:MAG: glycosyltransferase family 4 protein [Pseudomonadota bacterium]
MKTLHIESGRHLYGGAGQVVYLVRELGKRGIDSVLACPPGSAIADIMRGAGPGWRTVEVPMGGDVDVGLMGRLKELIHTERPDVVHIHSRRGADTFGALAARRSGVPVLLSRRVEHMERWPVLELKLALADRVVAISRGIHGLLLGRGLKADKLGFAPDAVDIPAFQSPMPRTEFDQRFDVAPGVKVIGVVAQLTPPKGHTHLVDALPDVVAANPNVQVLFFGKGPKEAVLREQVSQLGLDAVVRFCGFHDDIAQLLGCFDVLAHPAISEGLGVALLEAASAGVPIVTCAVGGIPEVVIDGETGRAVPPGDAPALAAALNSLLADPELAGRYASAALAHVEENFSLRAMVDGNVAAYHHLLGSGETH